MKSEREKPCLCPEKAGIEVTKIDRWGRSWQGLTDGHPARGGKMELKTSEEWQRLCKIEVLDPDGWDRKNFQFSWHEKIFPEQSLKKDLAHRLVLFREILLNQALICGLIGAQWRIAKKDHLVEKIDHGEGNI